MDKKISKSAAFKLRQAKKGYKPASFFLDDATHEQIARVKQVANCANKDEALRLMAGIFATLSDKEIEFLTEEARKRFPN